jgi:hypothetical protein
MQVAVPVHPLYNEGMTKEKTKISPETFRLTAVASQLLAACAQEAGVSKASIVEQAIRMYAKSQKVTIAKATTTEGE